MPGYDKKDAAADTGASTSQVAEAWHTARDDSGVRQGNDAGHFESAPDWADETTESGIPLFPDGKS
ncbi:MAG TPA: hypothetical protein VGE62_03055 [Candidatus Paceibacterota bacterium]